MTAQNQALHLTAAALAHLDPGSLQARLPQWHEAGGRCDARNDVEPLCRPLARR